MLQFEFKNKPGIYYYIHKLYISYGGLEVVDYGPSKTSICLGLAFVKDIEILGYADV